MIDGGADPEGQVPAHISTENNDQPCQRRQHDSDGSKLGRAEPHDERDGFDHDHAGHGQPVHRRGATFVARRLVEVRVAGQSREDGACQARCQRQVSRDRRHPPANDKKPVREHAERPGPDRHVGQGRVKGMPEDPGPVHHVLDRPARCAQRVVEPADGGLHGLGHRV